MKHSPAPWSVHPYSKVIGDLHEVKCDSGNFKAAFISIGSGETLIGEFSHFNGAEGYPSPTLEEMHANARLAIAAPELLRACEFSLALLEDPDGDEFGAFKAMEVLREAIAKAKGVA